MENERGSLAIFRIRLAVAVKSRMDREGLSLRDVGKATGCHLNAVFRALHPHEINRKRGQPYRASAETLFALVDWLGEDAGCLVQPRVTTTWREVEEAIDNLQGFTDWERVAMIEHLRLVRAASLRRERE